MLVLCRYKHKNGGEKTRLVNLQGEGKLLFACFFLGGDIDFVLVGFSFWLP